MKFTWKIGNRLNRKRNQFSGLCDFYFSSYGHFSVIFFFKSPQFPMITRKINIGEFFYYFSRPIFPPSAPFLTTFEWEKGGGWGFCMSVSGKWPNYVYIHICPPLENFLPAPLDATYDKKLITLFRIFLRIIQVKWTVY